VLRTPLLAAFSACVLVGAVAQASPAGTSTVEQLLLDEINRVRTEHGLSALEPDVRLGRAARGHSRTILRRGSLEHGAMLRRIQSYGVRTPAVGENLAWTEGAAVPVRLIVSRWLGSPPHRANLLRAGWRRIGVGDAAGRFRQYRIAHVLTVDFAE
jgi:uncharacterized protein YkwD